MPLYMPFAVRQNLRNKLGMKDECAKDLCCSVWCCPCSLAQTAKVAEQAATQPPAAPPPAAALVTHQPVQLRY